MGFSDERKVENPPRMDVKTSFFTRRLSHKLEQRGSKVPASVIMFLDTPLCTFDEDQRVYFEEKFCPLIPSIISILTEVFNEVGADREGWDDMISYGCGMETPIKICARAVLVSKEKEALGSDDLIASRGQRTKKIQLPPGFKELNPTAC